MTAVNSTREILYRQPDGVFHAARPGVADRRRTLVLLCDGRRFTPADDVLRPGAAADGDVCAHCAAILARGRR